MSPTRRRLFVTLLVAALLVGGWEFGTIVLDAVDPVSEKGRAANWVESHRAKLPQTWEAILRYPPLYRKAIFQALNAEGKSNVMRGQLHAFLASGTNLTSEQRAHVLQFIEAASPSAYEADGFDSRKEALASLCRRTSELFPGESARVFAPASTIGSAPASSVSIAWLSTKASLAASLRSWLPASLQAEEELDRCDCLLDSLCPDGLCSIFEACTPGDVGGRLCDPIQMGCGCGGFWN